MQENNISKKRLRSGQESGMLLTSPSTGPEEYRDPIRRIPMVVLLIGLVAVGGIIHGSYRLSLPSTHDFAIELVLGCGQMTVVLDKQPGTSMSSCYNSAPNGGEPSWSYNARTINVTLTASSPSSDTLLDIFKDGSQCARIQAGDHSTVPPRYPQTVSATC